MEAKPVYEITGSRLDAESIACARPWGQPQTHRAGRVWTCANPRPGAASVIGSTGLGEVDRA